MVPEIALTPAVAGQFYARFGDRVAILHSAFSDSERADQWRRIRAGGASVVVGTRSGVFAPVRNLGLIVVDEEHDASYKQEENPRTTDAMWPLSGRSMRMHAWCWAPQPPAWKAVITLRPGKYTLLEMPDRIAERPMPTVHMVDMREEFLETRKHVTFSRALLEGIRERLSNNEQAMVLLNRRGFSSFVACRSCGDASGVHQLRADPHLAQARPAPALPLLWLCGEGSTGLSEVPERAHSLHGNRFGTGGRRITRRIPGSEDRAA